MIHTAASSGLLLRDRGHDGLVWTLLCGRNVPLPAPRFAEYAEEVYIPRQHPAPQDSAFSLAVNTKAPIYKFLAQFPDRQARFFGAMEGVDKDPGNRLEHVVHGYPWAELDKATVVDVSS